MDYIYREISDKIRRHENLSEEELLQLMVLPLTVKGKEKKQELVVKMVELANQIPDREQTIRVLAGILTFSDKIIDDTYRNKIKEEMRMTKIGQMIFEEGMEEGIEQGEKKLAELTRKLIEDARTGDLLKATSDAAFRESLYHEYGMKQ